MAEQLEPLLFRFVPALKALQQSLDLQVGAAKGLTAGGIVAGAIGAQALNISLLPTIVALKIFGKTNSSFDPLTALVFRGFKDNLVTPNAMVAGQYIGKLSFQGYDTGTTNIVESGGIAWRVDPNNSPIGTDTMKGKMEVVTQAGSNSSPDLKYLATKCPPMDKSLKAISKIFSINSRD